MVYVIMSRGGFERKQKAKEPSSRGDFFKGHNPEGSLVTGTTQWTHFAVEAQKFATEEEAWHFAFDVWGMSFATRQMWVICMHTEALEYSEMTRRIIVEGDL